MLLNLRGCPECIFFNMFNEMGKMYKTSACQGLIVVFQRQMFGSCFEL
jgi:tRNA(Phe) wybutosine-synthesizing methylase Tyw3